MPIYTSESQPRSLDERILFSHGYRVHVAQCTHCQCLRHSLDWSIQMVKKGRTRVTSLYALGTRITPPVTRGSLCVCIYTHLPRGYTTRRNFICRARNRLVFFSLRRGVLFLRTRARVRAAKCERFMTRVLDVTYVEWFFFFRCAGVVHSLEMMILLRELFSSVMILLGIQFFILFLFINIRFFNNLQIIMYIFYEIFLVRLWTRDEST